MARPSRRTIQRFTEPLKVDPNPIYHVRRLRDGSLDHSMAFDPRYGPVTQDQIDYHIKHGTPGAELWEVGSPAAPYA